MLHLVLKFSLDLIYLKISLDELVQDIVKGPFKYSNGSIPNHSLLLSW